MPVPLCPASPAARERVRCHRAAGRVRCHRSGRLPESEGTDLRHPTSPRPACTDGSGEIDAKEAASLFASYCEPGASAAEIQRTAGNLLNTLDTDRSGRLSFEEFAFRQVDLMQDGATALTTLTLMLTAGHAAAAGLGVSCRWRWLAEGAKACRCPERGHPPRILFTAFMMPPQAVE